jgi:outer membrane protein assembly factor BamB
VKRFAVAAVVLLLLAVAAGGVWYWRASREHATVRGSPTVEFTPTQEPATQKRPAKVVANTPWPMYGYSPARTRVASQFDVRPPFRPVWSRRLWAIVEFPPVVAYNAVYVTQARGWVFKFQAETGRALWRKHFHRCSAASPAAGHQVLFVALMQRYPCNRYPRTQSGEVVAVRVRGGKILWRFKNVGVVESSPLLVKKTLYFGSWDHKLYALAVGGKRPVVKWTFTADNELNSSPAYAAGKIFVGSDSGSIYAIDAKTGKLVWHATSFSHFPRGREYFYATPAVAYGRVFAPNTDGWVYAYGAATGRLLWARHVGTYAYTAPAVWNKRVYVGTYDGYALALDAATGDVRWRYAAPAALHGAPSIVDGLVYFATCERCGQNGSRSAKAGPRETFALDARTGRLVWHIPDGQYSPVVADAGHVFVVGRGRIYAFEPRHAKHHAKTRAKKKTKARATAR